jgi:hypothetical protein
MSWKILKYLAVAVCIGMSAAGASADTVPVGVFSFDDLSYGLGSGATFGLDVTNYTGPVNGIEVVSTLGFEDLSLVVTYASGGTGSAGLTGDGFGNFSTGETFSGGQIVSAELLGTFSPLTVTLLDGSVVAIDPSFTATITDGSGILADGDFAVINVNTSPIAAGVAEPGAGMLLWAGLGLAGLLALGLGRRD